MNKTLRINNHFSPRPINLAPSKQVRALAPLFFFFLYLIKINRHNKQIPFFNIFDVRADILSEEQDTGLGESHRFAHGASQAGLISPARADTKAPRTTKRDKGLPRQAICRQGICQETLGRQQARTACKINWCNHTFEKKTQTQNSRLTFRHSQSPCLRRFYSSCVPVNPITLWKIRLQ